MKIILLGSGGYFPNRRRHTACLMIPEAGLVLDAGTAAYQIAGHLETDALDIVLSHAHLDHIFGLTCLLNLYDGKPHGQVRVHGQRDKLQAIQEHLFSELLFPVAPPCQFVPLVGALPLSLNGKLHWFPLEHPGGSIGMRLEWPGHSMAYVTDTIASESADYLDHIRGVDLLIHEAFFNDEDVELAKLTGHSTVTEVAKVARAANVERLVLVHMNPTSETDEPLALESAKMIFPNLQVGCDGATFDF